MEERESVCVCVCMCVCTCSMDGRKSVCECVWKRESVCVKLRDCVCVEVTERREGGRERERKKKYSERTVEQATQFQCSLRQGKADLVSVK